MADTIAAMSEAGDAELTIEELAQRVGMSVRNLREWQGLGLLEPPKRRGRVGYYSPAHVERIERIRALRADGFSLDLIRRILEDSSGAEDDAVAFSIALRRRWQDEEPEAIDLAQFAKRFGLESEADFQRALEEKWLERSSALGLLRARDDGSLEVRSPRLAQLAEFLLGLGLSMTEILALGERVYGHQEEVATIFGDVFRSRVFEPLERGESAEEGWAKARLTLEELRPFALDAVEVLFKLAIDSATDRLIQLEAERRGAPTEQ